MTLHAGRWRLPNWSIEDVLVVPDDGPWAYLHFPGMKEPSPVLIYECERHTDWHLCEDTTSTEPPA